MSKDGTTLVPLGAGENVSYDAGWNAAIARAHDLVAGTADGQGPLWIDVGNAGEVLDRLPNAIWELKR